jgi:hypothetical protein
VVGRRLAHPERRLGHLVLPIIRTDRSPNRFIRKPECRETTASVTRTRSALRRSASGACERRPDRRGEICSRRGASTNRP